MIFYTMKDHYNCSFLPECFNFKRPCFKLLVQLNSFESSLIPQPELKHATLHQLITIIITTMIINVKKERKKEQSFQTRLRTSPFRHSFRFPYLHCKVCGIYTSALIQCREYPRQCADMIFMAMR